MKFRLVYMELFAWEGEICHERFVNRSFGGSTWNHVYGDNRLGTWVSEEKLQKMENNPFQFDLIQVVLYCSALHSSMKN